jgi:hypothetical protein
MGGNPRFWLAAQNRAAGGKKCFPPFPAGQTSLTTRPPNKTKRPPERLFWVFGVRASWPRLRTAARRGRGKERANASDAHGSFPRRGSGGGRRGNRPAAKPGRRPGEPKGLSWGGGPSEAGWLVPPSPKEKFAEQTRRGCEACGADGAGTGAPRRLRSTRRGRAEARPPANGGRAPRRGPGGSQNQLEASSPDDDNELSHALVVLVHKLDVTPGRGSKALARLHRGSAGARLSRLALREGRT